MKKYKSNHVFTFMFQIYNFLLTLFPGIFVFWIFANGAEGIVYLFRMYMFLLLFAIVAGNAIHFLICLFTEHKVYIDEETITLK